MKAVMSQGREARAQPPVPESKKPLGFVQLAKTGTHVGSPLKWSGEANLWRAGKACARSLSPPLVTQRIVLVALSLGADEIEFTKSVQMCV